MAFFKFPPRRRPSLISAVITSNSSQINPIVQRWLRIAPAATGDALFTSEEGPAFVGYLPSQDTETRSVKWFRTNTQPVIR